MTTKTELNPGLQEALATALAIGNLPDVHWLLGDDQCDCLYQRIGQWTNPHLAQTLEVRLCCIWGELYKQYPEFVREVPAFYDANTHEWVTEPAPWNSAEMDMPRYLWYRQIARQTGRPLDEVRAEYAERDSERPRANPAAKPLAQPSEAQVAAANLARLRLMGWL